MIKVSIQQGDFSLADEYQQLIQQDHGQGAIVTFTGRVRGSDEADSENTQQNIYALELEHYPGMTENVLEQLAHKAQQKWTLAAITIIHRIGKLNAGEQIVFVGVCSTHRSSAFKACEYIMDTLKTTAPFWKKEFIQKQQNITERWVNAKESDQLEANKWQD